MRPSTNDEVVRQGSRAEARGQTDGGTKARVRKVARKVQKKIGQAEEVLAKYRMPAQGVPRTGTQQPAP